MYRPRSSNRLLCEDERCVVMHKDLDIVHDCTEYPNQCDYEISYKDGYSSMGVLLTDKFSLPMSNYRPNLAFGYIQTHRNTLHCIAWNRCSSLFICAHMHAAADMTSKVIKKSWTWTASLGSGRGTGDLVSQLKQQGLITENVVGHCLSSHGGGYLFFVGDVPSTSVTWLPMLQEYT